MAEEEPSRVEVTHNQPVKMTEEDEKKLRKEQGAPSKGYSYPVRDRRGALCAAIVIFLLLAGITALTVWLVYRPHKPKFRVVSAAVYELNATSPPFISTTMQFTVVTRNPNKRVSIFYNQLSAFVSYKNQAITPPVILPPLFHETKSTVALSPVLGGSTLPVPAEVVNGLMMDEAYGVVGLRLVLTGKLRYKAGAIRSRRYGVYVRCDLFVGLKKGIVGQLPLLGSPACIVDV
ncbi:NDR1/HIN1-like protein 12 [Sesamum indicum]|uniref:NDR1/HIN1-like protein 12 n=1 Tax=Sesamum indicum TaxID=4182 RepID=A0A6I9TZL5_SESIN|nr:NDR1/HIN1-like protein 12 [Sesamum indicum]